MLSVIGLLAATEAIAPVVRQASATWSVILERVDAPASGYAWAAGSEQGVRTAEGLLPIYAAVQAKRFEARDGSSVILAWNPLPQPVTPVWARPQEVIDSYSPENGSEAITAPIPANSLRLYRLQRQH